MKVLIAEDESRAMKGMAELVKRSGTGCEIVGEAYDGKEALEMIIKYKPDVCITDIRMPVMDGLDLIRAARAQGFKTKFIIVSAYEDFEFARQSVSLGVEDYLVKPVMKEDVENILEAIARGGHNTGLAITKGSLAGEYPDAHPLVKKVLRIIETSYAVKISLKEMASGFGVTQEYLCSIFSQNIGQGFARYLRSYRIEKAKEMLLDGMEPEEAALNCGIQNVKYFSAVFRDETGMTITEFMRENNR